MKLILLLCISLSVFNNAQVDSAGIKNSDTIDNSKNIDEVTITQFSVKKLKGAISTDVYSQQFFRKNPTPNIFESIAMVNGVKPQLNCAVCNTGDIHINGLEGA